MTSSAPRRQVIVSIRFKLLLAILVLISAFALGSFTLVQRGLRDSYRRTFDEQFQRETDAFVQRRLAHTLDVRNTIANAASSVRLLAAAYAGNGSRFYTDLGFAMSDLMQARARGGALPFLRFVTADGTMLSADESGVGSVPGLDETALAAILEPMAVSAGHPIGNDSGYVVIGNGTAATLYTVIVVPLIDPSVDEFLGEIFFGHPAGSVAQLVGRSRSDARVGLVVNDRLYSDTIPANVAPRLEGRHADGIAGTLRIGETEHVAITRLLAHPGRFARAEYLALFSLDGLQSTLVGIRARTAALVIVALGIAVLLTIPVAARFTRPIRELVAATDEVQRGNLDVSVPVRSRDELGVLTASFNAMTTDLALKDRYRDLLDKVTDPEIAEELLSGSIEIGGTRCDAAVLFCDVRGFTPFTRSVEAETLVRLLNEHMTAMTEIVGQHRGVVDKFIGDEVMAVFGVPRRDGSAESQAVACALAMLVERARMNRTSTHAWQIGIGIASGSMIAGCIGSDQRLSYTVLGERVNLGARLCSAAAGGQILIDEATQIALGESVPVRSMEGLTLKGIDEEVTAYEVVHEYEH